MPGGRRERRLLLLTLPFCMPGAISVTEIYPHDHYLLPPEPAP